MLNPVLRESFPGDDPHSPTEAYPNFLEALKAVASGHVSEEKADLVYDCLLRFYKGIFEPAQGK